MMNDIKFAFRMLLKAKGWTAVVILSLAIGIGAPTALFSAASGLLLRQLPVRDPDALVRLRVAGENDMATGFSDYGRSASIDGQDYGLPSSIDGARVRTAFSYPMYLELRKANETLVDLSASAPYPTLNLIADGHADLATAFICSGNYFQLLGLDALLGRLLNPADDRADAPPAAVISYRLWTTRFGKDPHAVGKLVRVAAVPVTIIGVLPQDFIGTANGGAQAPDITLPLALDPQIAPERPDRQRLRQPTAWWLQLMGRLKPGVNPRRVQANLDPVFRNAARNGLDEYLASLSAAVRSGARNRSRTKVPRLIVQSGGRGLTDISEGDVQTVRVLAAVVALMLLIVCANVANLLLARAATRQREISIRLSMGANRGRVILQMLIESVVLACVGGGFGAVIAICGAGLLPPALGRAAALDWRVLAFALAATMATGITFGILPALRATSVNLTTALKEQGRTVVRSRSYLAKALLVSQVAVSLVLVVGAALFLKTIANLRAIELGFNAKNLILFDVDAANAPRAPERFEQVYEDIASQISNIPGVASVSFSRNGLLSGSESNTEIFLPGKSYPGGHSQLGIDRHLIMPNFFQTMQIPLLRGRALDSRDVADAPKVVVINQAAARKFFAGTDPVGLRFGESAEQADTYEIVGVVADAKYASVRAPAPPTMYMPYAQRLRDSGVVFDVRTAAEPQSMLATVRSVMRQSYPDLPIANVSTQESRIEQRFAQEKLVGQAYAVFGGMALLLACIGLFGLMSYSVAQRTNEIGIRMALGADGRKVLRGVMSESMTLTGVGVVIGVIGAVAAGKFVESLLYGVTGSDVVSTALAVLMLMAVSAIAAFIPARRASRVDPMIALRYE
jgi:predicted permease